MDLRTLSAAEVLEVHNRLAADFAETDDPISPAGVRSQPLLESAVGRQHTSLGGTLKYPKPVENAATLVFGVCCDHPFHNGNKRTALVSMLVHLDRNKYCLFDTAYNDLHTFIIRVADHSLGMRRPRRGRAKQRTRQTDEEVDAIVRWLEKRAHRLTRGERRITWRELERILKGFGYHLEEPAGNKIGIYKHEEVKGGLLKRTTKKVRKKIGTVGWPGDNRDIAISEIKKVREICGLREQDGVDSESFYGYATVVDGFINHYRKLLRALAKD